MGNMSTGAGKLLICGIGIMNYSTKFGKVLSVLDKGQCPADSFYLGSPALEISRQGGEVGVSHLEKQIRFRTPHSTTFLIRLFLKKAAYLFENVYISTAHASEQNPEIEGKYHSLAPRVTQIK